MTTMRSILHRLSHEATYEKKWYVDWTRMRRQYYAIAKSVLHT